MVEKNELGSKICTYGKWTEDIEYFVPGWSYYTLYYFLSKYQFYLRWDFMVTVVQATLRGEKVSVVFYIF